jgi:Toastrack DUF4097
MTDPQTRTTIEHRIGPRGQFSLRLPAGEVSIRGVEGDLARVRDLDDDALDSRFRIQATDGALELEPVDQPALGFLLGRRSSADLEVEVPHGAAVVVETASADVTARDLTGSKHFRTASGDVALERLAGSVEVETVSGDVTIAGRAVLDVSARTVSGDAELRLPLLRRLELGTTSGDLAIDAELRGDGPFQVRSISGDTTIVARSGFRIEAETITGDLSSEVSHRTESSPGRKVLVVGHPGATLAFKSVSGDLEVVAPRGEPATLEASPARQTAAGPASTAAATAAGKTADEAAGKRTDGQAPADRRLSILRSLERGEIDVAEASRRLAEVDEVIA